MRSDFKPHFSERDRKAFFCILALRLKPKMLFNKNKLLTIKLVSRNFFTNSILLHRVINLEAHIRVKHAVINQNHENTL